MLWGWGGRVWNTELQSDSNLGPWPSQYHHLEEVLSHCMSSWEGWTWPDPGLTRHKIHWIGAMLGLFRFLFCLIFHLGGVASSLDWGEAWKERAGSEWEVRER